MMTETNPILWEPSQVQLEKANLTHFARAAIKRWKLKLNTYPDFYQWSIDAPEQFWQSVWEELGVIGQPVEVKKGSKQPTGFKAGIITESDRMPGARWFPGMRLNFAQNILKKHDSSEAMLFWGE